MSHHKREDTAGVGLGVVTPGLVSGSTTVYFHVVQDPRGPYRTGPPYLSKEVAKSWTRFVKAANRGVRVRVTPCRLVVVDGKLDAESLARLDQVFNLDPPDEDTMVKLRALVARGAP